MFPLCLLLVSVKAERDLGGSGDEVVERLAHKREGEGVAALLRMAVLVPELLQPGVRQARLRAASSHLDHAAEALRV